MIDIRAIVVEIVKAKDADDKSFAAHVHGLVRDYGQNLLAHVVQAIQPEKPEEIAIVQWLQGKLVEAARQIPGPETVQQKETK